MWAAAHDDGEQIGESAGGDPDAFTGGDREQKTPLAHDGIPITGYWRDPIRDLDALAQEDWPEALRPPRPWTRTLATGRLRTVSFRLGPDEHTRLLAAARLFGMRPTSLARLLTVRGVDPALHEERRDR